MSSSGFYSEVMPWDDKVLVLQQALDYTTVHHQGTSEVHRAILKDLRVVLPQLDYEEEEIGPPVEGNLNDEKEKPQRIDKDENVFEDDDKKEKFSEPECGFEDEDGNFLTCERPEQPLISRSFEVEEEDANAVKEEVEKKAIGNAENTIKKEKEGSYVPANRRVKIVDQNWTMLTRAQKKRLLETNQDRSVKKGEAVPKKVKVE